jgi:hypothetical protein
MDEPIKVPAIGYSVLANLGDEKQITFQHFVAADDSDATVNACLDRIVGLIDRQKARIQLPTLRDELAEHERTLAQFVEDKARLDIEFNAAQARRDIQIVTLNKTVDTITNDAAEQHAATGRQAAYKPTGVVKTNIERQKAGIAAIEQEKVTAVAERDQAHAHFDVSVKRYEGEIERRKAKIAELVERIEGG